MVDDGTLPPEEDTAPRHGAPASAPRTEAPGPVSYVISRVQANRKRRMPKGEISDEEYQRLAAEAYQRALAGARKKDTGRRSTAKLPHEMTDEEYLLRSRAARKSREERGARRKKRVALWTLFWRCGGAFLLAAVSAGVLYYFETSARR